METQRRRTGGRDARTGGRSERVVHDVLAAAIAEIARVGYVALRVEDVAAKAGVNKTTIYRRWPTKAELLADALRSVTDHGAAPPDTGSLRLDLLQLIKASVARMRQPVGRVMARVIAVEIDHPEVVAFYRVLREEHLAPWLTVIERAARRGEIPEGSDARLMAELIMGPVISKRLRLREPVDDAYLQAVVDLVVLGAKAGGAIRRTG